MGAGLCFGVGNGDNGLRLDQFNHAAIASGEQEGKDFGCSEGGDRSHDGSLLIEQIFSATGRRQSPTGGSPNEVGVTGQ
ncbi:hypothetical protein D3C71_2050840 [compost metagenome]